jgi:hypothetical protein
MSESASRPGAVFGLLGWLIALLFVGAILVVWAIAAASGAAHIVPDPGKAFVRLGAMLGEPAVQSAILATLASWAAAFMLGAALGLAIGIPAGRTRIGCALLAPLAFAASTRAWPWRFRSRSAAGLRAAHADHSPGALALSANAWIGLPMSSSSAA